MKLTVNKRLDFISLFFFLLVFLAAKFYFPAKIQFADQGRAEEILWGPLSILSAAIFLIIYIRRYLKEAAGRQIFLAVFIFLLIVKFEVLFFPPYGEVVAGPFAEALWLKDHSFNYLALVHAHNFTTGGPKVYLFSIYPTFQALLMKLTPSVKVFLIINHALVFAMA